jgi:hypothetical protein
MNRPSIIVTYSNVDPWRPAIDIIFDELTVPYLLLKFVRDRLARQFLHEKATSQTLYQMQSVLDDVVDNEIRHGRLRRYQDGWSWVVNHGVNYISYVDRFEERILWEDLTEELRLP